MTRNMWQCVMAMVFVIALMLTMTFAARVSHADPKPGLWQESVTQADGVTIRKIRDTTGGERVVCYVASRSFPANYGGPDHGVVAISCLPEKSQ